MNTHPKLKNIFTELTDEEYSTLKHSIETYGVLDEILVWGDTIIDGHNRYKIATELGIECPVKYIEAENIDDAINIAIQVQLGRRNITAWQRAEVALKYKDILKKNGDKGKLRDKLGNHAGMSGVTVEKIEKVVKFGPDWLVELGRGGEISAHLASEISDVIKDTPMPLQSEIRRNVHAKGVVEKIQFLKKRIGTDTYNEIMASGFIQNDDAIDFWKASMSEINEAMKQRARMKALLNTEANKGTSKPILMNEHDGDYPHKENVLYVVVRNPISFIKKHHWVNSVIRTDENKEYLVSNETKLFGFITYEYSSSDFMYDMYHRNYVDMRGENESN